MSKLWLLFTRIGSAAFAQPGQSFHVMRYSLELTPDIAARSVSGLETIEVRSLQPELRALEFSGNALVIDSALLSGMPIRATNSPKALQFELAQPLGAGQTATLQVVYHGVPKSGVVFTGHSVYTSYDACAWMICGENSPGDKAIYRLDLHVPAGMRSLGVGKLVSSRQEGAGSVDRWETPIPYSAYLYDFAVGPFTVASDKEDGNTYTYLGEDVSSEKLRTDFAETPAMARFLAEKAGVPLPGHAYAELLVPGKEAQEAVSYSILGKDYLDPGNDWAMIHEMAHQWWGNLITCATWKDFWLNEGITVFMTAAWKEQRYGHAAYEVEMENARAGLLRLRARGLDTTPLAYGGEYPGIGVRRTIQYGKGALFMDHLRVVMGETPFWAALRLYTQRFSGGTVTSTDLQKTFEESSGLDLSAAFTSWVFVPELKTPLAN